MASCRFSEKSCRNNKLEDLSVLESWCVTFGVVEGFCTTQSLSLYYSRLDSTLFVRQVGSRCDAVALTCICCLLSTSQLVIWTRWLCLHLQAQLCCPPAILTLSGPLYTVCERRPWEYLQCTAVSQEEFHLTEASVYRWLCFQVLTLSCLLLHVQQTETQHSVSKFVFKYVAGLRSLATGLLVSQTHFIFPGLWCCSKWGRESVHSDWQCSQEPSGWCARAAQCSLKQEVPLWCWELCLGEIA